uniref:Zgc:113279 n=1 Tax=Sinocyclocheilus grahami TaxID=75366 RepID=A0A672R6I4_SINGR
MVSSQVKVTGRHKPAKDTKHSDYSCGGSPLPAEPPSDANIPNLPIPTQKASGGSKAKNRPKKSTSEEKYLGVRVRMPVRDMLKNIRIAKGIDPKDLQHCFWSKGDKKRVNTGGNRRRFLKHQTKSLEELAIIVEVLEEDLKTCQSYRLPNKSPSASYSSEFWVEDASPQGFMNTNGQENEIPLSPSFSVPSETSPVHSVSSSYPSPTYSQVVEEGKRSLVYVIARRMAALKKLDIKDSEGKTPLHLAAQKNQHFMVVDLVSLGANINVKDRYGKTCLHLSAENGYIRVLEVLKCLMRNGVYINLEERDANGLSALQCAAVALNHTVRELELCGPAGWVRLQTLRKEQMIETLECLLQMECYLHTPVRMRDGHAAAQHDSHE